MGRGEEVCQGRAGNSPDPVSGISGELVSDSPSEKVGKTGEASLSGLKC